MKRNRIVLVVALAMFVASFFCASAMGSSKFITTSEFLGWLCAEEALIMPWGHDPSLNHGLLSNMALLFSGLINPIFLVTAVLMIRKRAPRLVNALRIVLLLMLPSCWVVFLDQHIWPLYGYFHVGRSHIAGVVFRVIFKPGGCITSTEVGSISFCPQVKKPLRRFA